MLQICDIIVRGFVLVFYAGVTALLIEERKESGTTERNGIRKERR